MAAAFHSDSLKHGRRPSSRMAQLRDAFAFNCMILSRSGCLSRSARRRQRGRRAAQTSLCPGWPLSLRSDTRRVSCNGRACANYVTDGRSPSQLRHDNSSGCPRGRISTASRFAYARMEATPEWKRADRTLSGSLERSSVPMPYRRVSRDLQVRQ